MYQILILSKERKEKLSSDVLRRSDLVSLACLMYPPKVEYRLMNEANLTHLIALKIAVSLVYTVSLVYINSKLRKMIV